MADPAFKSYTVPHPCAFFLAQGWETKRLIGPVLAAGALRLALLGATLWRTGTSVITSGDTASYLEPGRNLLLLGRFVTGALPELDRTPGYPLFLAVVSLPGAAFAALAQVILSVLSVVLVWRLARAVFADERTAILAAWLLAFEPVSVIYSVRLLPETLFVALLLLSLERMAVFLRGLDGEQSHPSRKNKNAARVGHPIFCAHPINALVAAGLALAAATFVRPVSYYLPLALAMGLAAVLGRVHGLRWKAPVVLLLSTLPFLAMWQMRNRVETGFGGFSSIVARNLYFYQAAEVTARVEHRPFVEVQRGFGYPDEAIYLARHPEQAEWNQARRVAFMGTEAKRILRAHPWVYLLMHLEGSVVVAFTPCAADLLRLLGAYPEDGPQRVVNEGPLRAALRLLERHPVLASVMAALEAVLLGLYLLAMRGALNGGARRDALWLLLGVTLYFFAVSGGAQAVGRYRLPVMPIVCTLAATCGGAPSHLRGMRSVAETHPCAKKRRKDVARFLGVVQLSSQVPKSGTEAPIWFCTSCQIMRSLC